MTRFLFSGILLHTPRLRQTDWYRDIIQFLPLCVYTARRKIRGLQLASVDTVLLSDSEIWMSRELFVVLWVTWSMAVR
jgi:hypothetical protein